MIIKILQVLGTTTLALLKGTTKLLCAIAAIVIIHMGLSTYWSISESVRDIELTNESFYQVKGLPAFNPDPIYHNDKETPLVHIELPNNNSCSGFVIDRHYIITAGHCLSNEPKLIYIQNQNRTLPVALPGIIVGFNMRVDYGLVAGDFKAFNDVVIEPNKGLYRAPKGRLLKACGFPEGQTIAFCSDVVSAGSKNFYLIVKGEAYPGMSGGPVFDSVSGVVVGLVEAAVGGDDIEKDSDLIQISPLTGFLGAFGIEPGVKR